MKILIVRHAEPDYSIDSLTAKGHREAALLAERIAKLNVKAFYVSPLGRAQATAGYTLREMNREAVTLPWLQEFRARCFDEMAGRERICWDYRPKQWQGRPGLLDMQQWPEDELVNQGDVRKIWDETTAGVDALLASHGYHRDGVIYRCENNTDDTIVLFCHFGIGAAVTGYLCGIPPMLMWQGFCMQPSSVTTIVSEERTKGEVSFRCMMLGDMSHLWAAGEKHSTAGLYAECYDGRDSTNPIEWGLD